jgi:hypothetical protein
MYTPSDMGYLENHSLVKDRKLRKVTASAQQLGMYGGRQPSGR